jgi:hypothetical protein
MNKCEVCGSDRILPGPAYAPNETQCMDCGSQFNRVVMVEPTQEEISVAIQEEMPPIPEGGFKSPKEAQEYLAKLKENAKRLGKPVSATEDRVNKPTKKKHPVSDFPPHLVMAELHYYQRQGESFQEVLATGKGERGVRNTNVLIYCHNHISGYSCTNSCREIIENG